MAKRRTAVKKVKHPSRKLRLSKSIRNATAIRKQRAAGKAEKSHSDQSGAARAEGIRLFQLAGRPTKEQFIAVYGELGARWTWEQRAKSIGLNTAEEAARKFRDTLAKVAGA